ncbi:MAG: KilA-N domain-containing protein, partial [Bacteroidetes bacterium]|nr:KilA-N domain-containing protein [Bacteroidota bacterium]
TAKEWRETNPEKAQNGNIRDYADIIQLNVLANLESLNSVLIERGVSKEKRFGLLAETAISQYKKLSEQESLKRLE